MKGYERCVQNTELYYQYSVRSVLCSLADLRPLLINFSIPQGLYGLNLDDIWGTIRDNGSSTAFS